ncbi:MAG TPA: hypothetical protein VK179_14560 [Bacteroidales bacterium]|nr:hypothetical protein [Bacteroidales bacterium]
MKKYTIFNLAALVFFAGTFVACEYSQDTDPVISPDNYPKVTVTPVGDYSALKEGDTIYYTASIDKMNDRALTISARVKSGAANADDFIVSPAIIQPYTTSATMMIIFPTDWDAEPTEDCVLEIGIFSLGEKYQVNPSTVFPTANLTIENYVSPDITVSIGWSGEVSGMEAVEKSVTLDNGVVIDYIDSTEMTYDAADMVDFDVLVSPAADFDPANPWASEIGNYSAATGKNPEEFIAALEDGEYIIWADLWVNDFYNTFYEFLPDVKLPVTANFRQQGTALNEDIVQQDSQAPYASTPGADDAEGGGFDGVIAKIVVANGLYSVEPYVAPSFARKNYVEKVNRPNLRK